MQSQPDHEQPSTSISPSVCSLPRGLDYSTQTLNSYRLCHSHLRFRPSCNPDPPPLPPLQQINNNLPSQIPSRMISHHQTANFSEKSHPRLPSIHNRGSPPPELSESALEERLLVLPKLNNSQIGARRKERDSSKEQYRFFRKNREKKPELTVRQERKSTAKFSRKELNTGNVSEVGKTSDEDHNRAPTTSVKDPDKQNPQSTKLIPQKQRILTDVTINESNFTDSPESRPTNVSLVKAFSKKGLKQVSPIKRMISPPRRMNRSKRFMTESLEPANPQLIQAKTDAADNLLRSQTNPVVSSVSLFNEIQSTLLKRQQPNSKRVIHHDFPQFHSNRSANPTHRIFQLQNRLKRLQQGDRSPKKTDLTLTTIDSSQIQTKRISPQWRHVTVRNSAKNMIIEESSFNEEVSRLQEYMNRNEDLIQKYVRNRKELIQTVLNVNIQVMQTQVSHFFCKSPE